MNDTLDRVQKAVEEFFKKTRTTLFEFDKVRVAQFSSTEQLRHTLVNGLLIQRQVISKQRELTYNTRKVPWATKIRCTQVKDFPPLPLDRWMTFELFKFNYSNPKDGDGMESLKNNSIIYIYMLHTYPKVTSFPLGDLCHQ